MSDKIEKLSDIQDEAAFLRAYEALKKDVTDLRAEVKGLEKERDDLTAAAEALSPEALDKMKSKALRAEIKSILEGDGIKNAERILKYLDLKDVDFDEKDNIVGLDDKLDEIKKDFPELFDAKKRAGSQSADIHANTPPNTTKSTTEAQVDALFA